MQVPAGLKAELHAAEPLLANPVAFCFDEQGRIYVAETFRLHKGVTDNRNHSKWLDDDLAARTVADRLAMYRKYNYDAAGAHDRVRRLEASSGRGKPDRATIFAAGFNRPEDGLGSGLLAWRGNVYFTCIPDLWLLRDTKGDGTADVKKSLHTGYGVHVAFIGHDLHGLKLGPDGKLYFSIGDRGLHVETEGRLVSNPDSGAVLRCNLDGSGLELVHVGLRNPQELAFDKYGNLFTVDNNADGGDQARLVHLVPGGDSGWRIGYQYLPRLGMWNDERVWQPDNDNRGAAYLPPLANVANGPSGLTYHPGVTLLPEKYKDTFFLCDFRGGSGGSGIHALQLKARGATFELARRENFVWSILATDCDFGPDGGFYLSDWVEGWGLPGKGRIYRITDPGRADDAAVKTTEKLIGAGMTKRANDELVTLLGHDDMRVRLEAQYVLAERNARHDLDQAARTGPLLARLHAIWGLGQIGFKDATAVQKLTDLLQDPELEVRANTCKVMGESRCQAAHVHVRKALADHAARVKFHAALALGRIGTAEDVPALLDVCRGEMDPYLRHAVVTALAGINHVPSLEKAARAPVAAVRLAALLAWRRLASPEVARFLNDVDPRLVLEAARAIHDRPIPAALPSLAKLSERPLLDAKQFPADLQSYLLRRVVAAHARLGDAADARALATFAGRPEVPEANRLEALKLLEQFATPSGRDPIVGVWRPVNPRADGIEIAVTEVVRSVLPRLLTAGGKVRSEGIKLAARYGIKEVGPALRELAADASQPAPVRIETLRALEELKDAGLQTAAEVALQASDGRLRHAARRILLAKAAPAELARQLRGTLNEGSTAEKQGALELLAQARAAQADEVLAEWMQKLLDKKVPPEVALDIVEAVAARKERKDLADLLSTYLGRRSKDDPLAAHREALAGGDAEVGRRVFERTELSCVRCHKVQGTGGEVGPDLTGLAKRVERAYILESLVDPNRQIAKGFETVVLELANGQVKSGILRSEDAGEVRLMTPEGQILIVPKAEIESRSRGLSAMPADLIQKITRRELRDLIEFLAGL
jgi:quinoprotein glucose dehydrogenase